MNKKLLFTLIFTLVAAAGAFAAEDESAEPSWKFTAVTDFAWYPKSAYVADTTSHFAPITGAYSGVQIRTTFNAAYKIPVLTSSGALFSGNNVTLTGSLELTPITLMPKVSISFTPIAFLNFSAGGMAGTGWDLIGMQAMSQYNSLSVAYDSLPAFSTWYFKGWANGTFMFDVAALWPGDWHHIVTVATYEVSYTTMTNETSAVWDWQTSKNSATGLQFYQSYVLGYQMPTIVSIVGVRAELAGHYDAGDYGVYANNLNGSFITMDVSPLMQLTFSKKDSMYIMFNFESRRGFAEVHTKTDEEPLLTYTGSEWFFNRVAFSWTHTF